MKSKSITSFDRETLRQLQAQMLAALQNVCEPLGVQVKTAGGSFSEFEFTAKFKVAVTSTAAKESKASEHEATWNAYAPLYGLKPEWFGREFVSGQAKYKIVGFMPRRSKFPVLAQRVGDGKAMLFPVDAVQRKFAAS